MSPRLLWGGWRETMAENKKLQAMGRLKARLQHAWVVIGSDSGTWEPPVPVPGHTYSAPTGVTEIVGGLGGVWDSPKAEEIAAGINNTVTTARARVAEAHQAAVSAEAAERRENTETVDDDSDEAKPKWDT